MANWLAKKLYGEGITMIEIIREFQIADQACGKFELVFGPGGAWSKLYAKRPGFRGITLLRDTDNARRYLTVEIWDTTAQRDHSVEICQSELKNLEAEIADWADSQTHLGVFRLQAEATVYARKPGRRIAQGKPRRGSP